MFQIEDIKHGHLEKTHDDKPMDLEVSYFQTNPDRKDNVLWNPWNPLNFEGKHTNTISSTYLFWDHFTLPNTLEPRYSRVKVR